MADDDWDDEVHATGEFNRIWQNNQEVCHAVLDYARELLRTNPTITDMTLGRNVKDRVFAWAFGGGWGYSTGWGGATSSLRDSDRYPGWVEGPPPPGYRANPFSYFLPTHAFGRVDEEEVGEEVRETIREWDS